MISSALSCIKNITFSDSQPVYLICKHKILWCFPINDTIYYII